MAAKQEKDICKFTISSLLENEEVFIPLQISNVEYKEVLSTDYEIPCNYKLKILPPNEISWGTEGMNQ